MIRGIRSVAVGVADIDAASRFFTEVWNLDPVASNASSTLFRGTAGYHHIVALQRTPAPTMLRVVFDVRERSGVDRLHDAIAKAAIGHVESPGAVDIAGGGYGFGCQDPEGRCVAFVTEAADHAEEPDAPDRVTKITHVNLNCKDMEATFNFYAGVLGFKLIDESAYRFLHCDTADHCTMVLAPARNATLNHIAFELPDLDSVMRGAGRMRDNGYPIEWGVGRHGPGNNVFAYFAGPEELPLEYTAEVAQVDDGYRPNGPEFWRFPPGRTDRWGVTNPRTKRWERIQQMVHFDPDSWRVTASGSARPGLSG